MFSILSRRCPLLATSVSVLFCLLSVLISDSRFDLVWFRLSCDHGWIRSGSVNVRKQQQQQQQLQPRPDLLRSWSGITNSAVRMMAAANAASTSSTLLSPGGFALRCLSTAVTTSCRSWGSVTRRLRSTGGLAETLSRRFRAKWPRSLTGADTMLCSEIGSKEGWGCTVKFRTCLRSRCLVRMYLVVDAFFAPPVESMWYTALGGAKE